MPEKWEKVKLSDVATIKYGKDHKKLDDGKIPVYGTGGVMRYVDTPLYGKKSVLIPRKGSLGNLFFVEKPFWTVDTLFYTEIDENRIIPEYLYYKLKTFDLANMNVGSAVPSLTTAILNPIEFELPPIEVQSEIAKTLGVLDKKIESNKEINHHLEQMIHLNFSNYFSNKSYEKKALGEICSVTLGGTPSRSKVEYWNGTIPWINSGEINKFRIISPSEHITELGLVKSSTKLLPKHTTVLAITGATLGQVSLLEIDSCSNQSVVGVQPSEELPYTFIYPFIVNKIHQLIAKQTGGAQQHINKGNVEELSVPLYTSNTIEEYNSIVEPIFNKISNNCFENERLIMLRDSLLPKLMSGELSVTG
ncbi:restriction endonuclease subunit S [Lactococcus cremoris]|uniref:restriction endonuclease subunit S n=2 Tax=Lactococcus TaxID=1357 RepID=UPI001107A9AA|nr:restriction endonuclease subunit S [Lactococcus cremoris]TLQ07965.1 restriction endonuclease subunit S [Lactococcus cremoris]